MSEDIFSQILAAKRPTGDDAIFSDVLSAQIPQGPGIHDPGVLPQQNSVVETILQQTQDENNRLASEKRKRDFFIMQNPDLYDKIVSTEKKIETESPEIQESVMANIYGLPSPGTFQDTKPVQAISPYGEQYKPTMREFVKEGMRKLTGVGPKSFPGLELTDEQEARYAIANTISSILLLPTIPFEIADHAGTLIKDEGFWQGAYQSLQELARFSPDVLGELWISTGQHPFFQDPERIKQAQDLIVDDPIMPILAVSFLKHGGGIPKAVKAVKKTAAKVAEYPVEVKLKDAEVRAFRRVFNDPEMAEGKIVEKVKTMPKDELVQILREKKTTMPLRDAIKRIFSKDTEMIKEVPELAGELVADTHIKPKAKHKTVSEPVKKPVKKQAKSSQVDISEVPAGESMPSPKKRQYTARKKPEHYSTIIKQKHISELPAVQMIQGMEIGKDYPDALAGVRVGNSWQFSKDIFTRKADRDTYDLLSQEDLSPEFIEKYGTSSVMNDDGNGVDFDKVILLAENELAEYSPEHFDKPAEQRDLEKQLRDAQEDIDRLTREVESSADAEEYQDFLNEIDPIIEEERNEAKRITAENFAITEGGADTGPAETQKSVKRTEPKTEEKITDRLDELDSEKAKLVREVEKLDTQAKDSQQRGIFGSGVADQTNVFGSTVYEITKSASEKRTRIEEIDAEVSELMKKGSDLEAVKEGETTKKLDLKPKADIRNLSAKEAPAEGALKEIEEKGVVKPTLDKFNKIGKEIDELKKELPVKMRGKRIKLSDAEIKDAISYSEARDFKDVPDSIKDGYWKFDEVKRVHEKLIEKVSEQELAKNEFRTAQDKYNKPKPVEEGLKVETARLKTAPKPVKKDSTKKPARVYHGTPKFEGEEFIASKLGENTGARSAREGFFFSSSPEVAETYMQDIRSIKKTPFDEFDATFWGDIYARSIKNLTDVEFKSIFAEEKPKKGTVTEIRKRYIKETQEWYDMHTKKGDPSIDVYPYLRDVIEGISRLKGGKADTILRGTESKLIEAEITTGNIKEVDWGGKQASSRGKFTEAIQKAKKAGFDAIRFKNIKDAQKPGLPPADVFVVFSSKHIKQVENKVPKVGEAPEKPPEVKPEAPPPEPGKVARPSEEKTGLQKLEKKVDKPATGLDKLKKEPQGKNTYRIMLKDKSWPGDTAADSPKEVLEKLNIDPDQVEVFKVKTDSRGGGWAKVKPEEYIDKLVSGGEAEVSAEPSEGTFVVNRETKKLELHFSKEDYQALDPEVKKMIKSYFLFSRNKSAWISKASRHLSYPKTIAAKAGLTDGGKIGEKISFAERMEREAERAEVKAERAGETAMKRKREGEQLQGEFNELRKDWAFITQPIMSGHAGSEAFGRQRSRIMARYDKGFEKYSQSEYYQKKAERLRRAAKQTKLKDPVYLSRRIKENRRIIANIKKNIPDYEERLAKAETDADKAKYQGWLEEVMDNLADRIDKLTFFTEAMENIGGLKYTKEKLKGATHVVYRKYGWYPVIRLNPKTVTIGNWLDVETSTWKAPYAEITDAKFKEQEVAKPKGLEKLEKPAAGKSLADHGLQVQELISKKGRPYWIVTGNTKPNKDLLKSLGARYNKYKRGWSFFNGDPTNIINDAFEAVAKGEPITTPDTEKSGARERDHAEVARLKGIRTREDERPDERRTSSDLGSYVSKQTHDLIYKGRDYGIPDDVLSEQVDDVAFINQAYQNGKQMFVLANEAGTGKTFVLGGAIRELKASGAQRIVYVTMNNNLIKQIKNDLQEYGIPGVEFFTYSKIRSTPIGATDVVIFDESQNIKNLDSKQGKSAQLIIGDTKFTIFSSATPFENPVEAKYFEKSGVFQKAGGFLDWAKAYGAQTIKKKYFDYAAGVQVIEEKPIWRGGKVEDGQAARKWFFKQGIMTQRNMRIPVDMVDTGFQKVEVDKYWADVYEKVTAGFEAAMNRYEGPDGKPTDPIMYMQLAAYKTNLQKRILESAKVQTGIARAKDHLADGRNVVIFVETKAQRRIYNTEPYDEMVARYVNWKAQRQAGITADGEKPPYSKVQLEVARIINEGEFDFDLGSTTETISKAFGSDKVAIYTGEVTDAAANRNLDSWRMKKKPVLVATMAKGGTGLSLHDTGGDRPTSQVNINLPWKATGVDQVSGRTARYGLRSKANIEWIFANNIPFDVMLSGRVGQRMADMGAIVKGLDLESAKLLQDFDFEGRVNIQRQDKTVLYSKEELQAQDSTEDIYKRAARLEDTRLKAQYTEGDFFETPYPVSVLVSRIANIQPGDNILEPSAGRGSLLKFLPEGVTINAIEQRNDNWEYLKEHFELAGISGRGDFLEKAEGFRFDAVIMNPPFGRLKGVGWQDATHVLKAYDNLMPGGRLVAIMGEGSFFRSDNQSTEFRDWLEDVGATVVTLPENTFKKSGTGVRTRLVVIDKNSDTGRTDYELDNIEDIQRVEDFFILERDNQQKKVNYGASPGFIDFSSVHSQFLKKIASENEKFEKLFLQQEYKSGNPIDWLKSVKERYTGKLELQPPEIHVKKADLPEDSPMSANAIKDSFRHIKDVTRFAREEAVRTIEDIVAPLKNAEDMALFERLIITRDLIATAKEGMAVPYELTEEELVKELARLMEISSDNVLQTVENHFLKMQEQGLDLVERGKIEKPRDDYFPHKVIEYYQNFNRISGTGPRFKGPYRPYTRMREGSDKPIKTDYINTMIGHLTKLYSDNMVDDFQAEILNKLDITGRLVEEVRKEEPELTYQEALKEIQIPDGYTKYQPNPGNFYYTGSKVTDSVLESATEEFFNSLDMMMKSGFPIPPRVFDLLNAREALMVGHKRPTFILPSTLAKQFTQYRKYEMVHGWEKIIHDLTMAWKWNVLVLNPKYQFKNLMGDSLNLFFDDATAFTKHPEAMLMLIDRSMQRFGLKKLNPVELSTKIQALVDEYGYKAQTYVDLAEELGVIDSGFTGKEIAEIFAMPEFRRFARNILESGKIVMKEIPKGLREISTIRENWARLAKFLKDLDRIEKGKKYLSLDDRVKNVFRKALGLAQITPKSVKTKTTNIEGLDSIGAAAKASREALLDYGAFSKAEDRWLRRALVPFWAWLKGNLKMQTTRATKYPINYFTKLALISTALYLWNHRDEESSEFEEKLPEWAKHMPHINLMIGGSYRNLMIDSPWSDAAETLGLTGALVMLEGGSAAEGFNQGIEDATKKWGSSLNFLAKESLEQGVGRDFFTGYRFLPYKKKGETDEQYAIRALQARKKHALENIRFIAALNRMERMKDQGRPVIEEFLPIRSFPPKKKKTGLQKLKRGI